MKKRRFMAAFLAILMVLTIIPLDSINVKASTGETAGFKYTYDETNRTAAISGYSGESVTSIVIPATTKKGDVEYTVNKLNTGVLTATAFSGLSEITVIGDTTEVADAFKEKVNSNMMIWCNYGSKAYDAAAGLSLVPNNVRYLNVKDISITVGENAGEKIYYTGCADIEASAVIAPSSDKVNSEDIIWKTSDPNVLRFVVNGNLVDEVTGEMLKNNSSTKEDKDGATIYTVLIRTIAKGKATISAECRGTGANASQEIEVRKATKNIIPKVEIYKPVRDTDGNAILKNYKENGDADSASGDIIVEKYTPGVDTYFDGNTLYIDKDMIFVIDADIDADCDDYIINTNSIDDYIATVNKVELTSDKYVIDSSEDEATKSAKLSGVVLKDGTYVNGNVYYASNASGASGSTVTLFSQNKVLQSNVAVKVCEAATEINMKASDSGVENGKSYSWLNQSTLTLSAELVPSTSTDTVLWTSSDESVGQISDGNTLYLKNSGFTTITCTVLPSKSDKRAFVQSFGIFSLEKQQYTDVVFTNDDKTEIVDTINVPINTTIEKPKYLTISDAKDGKIYTASSSETAANEPVTYTSSDTELVNVQQNGKIYDRAALTTGTKTGKALVTATTESGIKKSVIVNVYAPANSINVSTAVSVPEGQEMLFPYSLNPDTATEDVTWSSRDDSVVVAEDYIDENGKRYVKVIGKKATDAGASVQITGKTVQTGVQVRINATIVPAVHADVLSVNIDGEYTQSTDESGVITYNVAKASNIYFTPQLKNSNGLIPNDKVRWTSEAGQTNLTLSQDGDVVTATGATTGKTKLTITAYGGTYEKTLSFYVNVYVPAEEVYIRKDGSPIDKMNLEIGTTVSSISAALNPDESTDTVTWSTDNDNITLSKTKTNKDESIAITSVKTGRTVLTAKCDSGKVATTIIDVIKTADSIEFTQNEQVVDKGYVVKGMETTVGLKITGENTTDKTFTWNFVNDSGILSIVPNSDGTSATIKGLANGSQTVQVMAPSGKSATFDIVVVQPAEKITLNNTSLSIYKGDPAVNICAALEPLNTTDVVTWTVDKEDVIKYAVNQQATTDASKQYLEVQGIGVGTVNLKATTVSGLSAVIQITVNAKPIENIEVTSVTNQIYTGKEITPLVNVSYEGTSLVQGTDYTVSYSDNVNVGTAKITITGIGNYAGDKEVDFKIEPKSIQTTSISQIDTQVYTGKEITPEFTIHDIINGTEKLLVANTDYTYEYVDNVNVGTATLKIAGKNNYSGELEIAIYIEARSIASAEISIEDIADVTYNGNQFTPDVVIKDGTKTLKNEVDYTLSYADNYQAGVATITIYGCGNYGMTNSTQFKIKKKSIASAKIAAIAKQNYTGENICPSITAAVGKISLSDNDYTITYKNNKKPGKATVVLTGKGNFTSTASASFIILPGVAKNVKLSSVKTSSLKLSWTKAYGASGYYVYAYNAKNGKYTKIGSTTKNSYTVKKLSAGTDYSYQIYAYVKSGNKTYRSAECVDAYAGTVAKTTKISKASSYARSVTLEWKEAKGANEYQIYYSTSKKGKYKLATTSIGTSVSIDNLKAKKTYYFKVRAYRTINGKNYYSSFSAVKAVKVKA